MDHLLTYNKLAQLPREMQAEVMDFIEFLLSRKKENKSDNKPQFGSGKGMFTIKPGFDDPLDDFKEYM
jgi:hypothetical protein